MITTLITIHKIYRKEIMKYNIKHETQNSIRVRIDKKNLSYHMAEAISNKLNKINGVTNIEIYRGTGGIRAQYTSADVRNVILNAISDMDIEDITREEESVTYDSNPITARELRERGFDNDMKAKFRRQIWMEAVTDVLLPEPVNIAMHVFEYAKYR